MSKQLIETKEKVTRLEQENSSLINEKSKLERKLIDSEKLAHSTQKLVIEKESLIKETTEKFSREKTELINQITTVSKQLSESSEKVTRLEKEKITLIEEKTKVETKLFEKETILIDNETKFKQQLNSSIKDINEKFNKEKNDLLNEVKSCEKKLKETVEYSFKLEREKTTYQEEKKKLETKLIEKEKTVNDNEKIIKEKFNTELKELQQAYERLQKENNDLTSQLKMLQKKLNESNNMISKIENEKILLQEDKDRAELNVKKIESKLKIIEKESEDLKKKLNTPNEREQNSSYRPVLYPDFNEKHLISLVKKKEEEVNSLTEKLFVEQTELGRVKRLSEQLTDELRSVKFELNKEKNSRIKAEKERNDNSKKIEELGKEIEKSALAHAALNEIHNKSENEIFKMKQDFEITNRRHDIALNQLKYDHEDIINKLNIKIEQLTKKIIRLEKEKNLS